MLVESTDNPPGRLPLSTPKDPPVTFEGIAIAVALAALLAYHVYVAIEPHFKIPRTSTESIAPLPPERHGR
jgi:hypothetical protein